MLYKFLLITFFKPLCWKNKAMKSRSDKILYGKIPIEIDRAIYPQWAIYFTCHFLKPVPVCHKWLSQSEIDYDKLIGVIKPS